MPHAILSPAATAWTREADRHLPQPSLRRVALFSAVVIVLGLGGLLLWAGLTTIESAVPATGVVIPSGKRKTVTLLEPGLLRELMVKEGDHVVAGQVLLKLDDNQIQAARNQAKILYWSAKARALRLTAEAADVRQWPAGEAADRAAAGDPAVAAAFAAEQRQFDARWAAFDSSIRVQERKISQTQAQIGAVRAQIASAGTRLDLLRQEIRSVDYLLARGLQTKPHQLELLRNQADAEGQIGQLASQLTQAQQSIAQTELEIVNAAETRRAEISKDRADTQSALADAEQRLRAADDQLAKREIVAPETGIVTDLKFFTVGSSIGAGQPIMDIAPETTHLLIEGTVAPGEVEHLAIGQRVNIRLTAYKAHRVPVITGRLTYVGADRQMDANNQPVFLVRATIDDTALANKPGVVLLPGMPADILIINGERSVLSFLASPITDSLFHAMKEE